MRDAQIAAAQLLSRVLEGRRLDQSLAELWQQKPQLTSGERGLIQDLSYGTLRHLGQIDAILNLLLTHPLKDEQLRHLLRVSLYQLQHTRGAPHVIVDQAVGACIEIKAAPAKGLINAILRNFLRGQKDWIKKSELTPTGLYSFPPWWIDKIMAQYPHNGAEILLSANSHPPMSLRVNTSRISRKDYLDQLLVQSIMAVEAEMQAVILEIPLQVQKIPGFAEGLVSVQDISAQRAALLLDVHDGHRVLDACAAPGGKTAHLLELAKIELTSIDNDERRLRRVRENLQRLGLAANVLCADVRSTAQWWDKKPYDRILADVPCSASGVVRRRPDIKWQRKATDIERFAQTQKAIVEQLWPLLAKGGKFLYVTCSVFEQENQQQVQQFLQHHPDARQLDLPLVDFRPEWEGQILPDAWHDGFYYALFTKI